MSEARYPDPPWNTQGRALFASFLVPADALELPRGLEPEIVMGRYTTGLLGYVEYVPPSPLTYRELLWMPCRVRALAEGRTRRGFHVDQMVVDSEASVAGGRALWALPKILATFENVGDRVVVRTERGATIEVRGRGRGPSWSAPTRMATLQTEGEELVRFASEGTCRMRSGRLELVRADGASDWHGLAAARRLPAGGVELTRFETRMLPATASLLDLGPREAAP